MSGTRRAPWILAAMAFLVAGALGSCGGDDIVFPGDDDDDDETQTLTVKGNIDDVSPVTTRDIVVFVFNVDDTTDRGVCVGGDDAGKACGSDPDFQCGAGGSCDPGQCPCPVFPGNTSDGKAAVIESGNTEFTLSGLDNGAIKVVFLLDNPGDAADGTIDPGDPIAVLDDDDCEIDDLDSNLTVTLTDVDIEFASAAALECEVGSPPAQGRAHADLITQERSPDGN